MGNYIPSGRRTRSLVDTLSEAEEDHYLDCPDADFWSRAGALLLDGILFFLLHSAMLHIAAMIVTYILPDSADEARVTEMKQWINYSILVTRVSMGYIFFCWTVHRFGGTPAKLLLGLRVLDAGTGQKLSGPRVLLRELLGKAIDVATLGIGLALPLMRPDHRALHDIICGSVVKKVRGE